MFYLILKDTSASKKAWLSRARAISHAGYDKKKNLGYKPADGGEFTEVEKAHLAMKNFPPAWKDALVSNIAGSDLIGEGTDKNGKRQPLYSLKHDHEVKIIKFARTRALNQKIPALVSGADADMHDSSLSERMRDNAATAYLMAKTGFRPGGAIDYSKDPDTEQAYGASTLEARHIKVEGDTITFTFNGKHTVSQNKVLKDASMAKYLNEKLATLEPRDTVFVASGGSINNYMKKSVGKGFTSKDLRTWNGASVAATIIASEPTPSNAAELQDQQKRVAKLVSEHLGNTPRVAFDSYIDPLLWKHTGDMTEILADPTFSEPKKPKESTPKTKVKIKS